MTGQDNVVFAVLALAGAGFLALAAFLYGRARAFLKETVITTGDVVRLKKSGETGEEGKYITAVVRFQTASGKQVEFDTGVSSNFPLYDVGESVSVVYRPERPEEAEIRAFLSLYGKPAVLAVLGGCFLVFDLIWYFESVKLLFGFMGALIVTAAALLYRNARTSGGTISPRVWLLMGVWGACLILLPFLLG